MIYKTADGSHSIQSNKYGVSYHSKHGAITETQHVFIQSALAEKAKEQQDFRVLGIGFGTGLNALMTYIASEENNWKIAYEGVEAYPLEMEAVKTLNYAQMTGVDENIFHKMHECVNGQTVQLSPNFSFKKRIQTFESLTDEAQFDVIYFDAFAPTSQPELWEEDILQKMYAALRSGGIMTTYCCKGVVRRRLISISFEVEKIPGPPGKREMLRMRKP